MNQALAILVALIALPAAAQAPNEPPAPQQREAAKDKPPLKLKLDELPGGRGRIGIGGREKEPGKDLPMLGGDARTLPSSPPGATGTNSPFPKDTATQVGR
jgi:hypothetical protein